LKHVQRLLHTCAAPDMEVPVASCACHMTAD